MLDHTVLDIEILSPGAASKLTTVQEELPTPDGPLGVNSLIGECLLLDLVEWVWTIIFLVFAGIRKAGCSFVDPSIEDSKERGILALDCTVSGQNALTRIQSTK